MIATIEFAQKWFPIYNKEYFDGELPTPKFELIKKKRVLGEYQHCNKLDIFGNLLSQGIFADGTSANAIRLSVYYDRTERDLQQTLIHEMIHFYIDFKGIEDNGSHGKEWTFLAERINKQGGWSISRLTSTKDCSVNPNMLTSKVKVIVFAYKVGTIWKMGLGSEKNIEKYRNWVSTNYDTYIIGKIDKNHVAKYSMGRVKTHIYNISEDFVNNVILPNMEKN